MKNCAIGGCEHRSHDTCPTCIHWTPSSGSKYSRCALFMSRKITCDLPMTRCPDCSYHLPVGNLLAGRPNLTGFDWSKDETPSIYRKLRRLPLIQERAARACAAGNCNKEAVSYASREQIPESLRYKIPAGDPGGFFCRRHITTHKLA